MSWKEQVVKEAIHFLVSISEERIEKRSGSLQDHVSNDLTSYGSALHPKGSTALQ